MGAVRWVEGAPSPTLEVELHPRANSGPVCSDCGQSGPGYDRLPARRFEFVPFWGMKVFLVYAPRRVECTRCGVRVEEMPWAEGKHPVTRTYAWFLANWAKRLSWKEVAQVFQSSWDVVFGAVEMAVAYGREHLDLSGIQSLGTGAPLGIPAISSANGSASTSRSVLDGGRPLARYGRPNFGARRVSTFNLCSRWQPTTWYGCGACSLRYPARRERCRLSFIISSIPPLQNTGATTTPRHCLFPPRTRFTVHHSPSPLFFSVLNGFSTAC
jgi:hypothetical protein